MSQDEHASSKLYIIPMPEKWLTVHQAAELGGYHYNHIRQIISAGKLHARRFGSVWQVNRTVLLSTIEEAE